MNRSDELITEKDGISNWQVVGTATIVVSGILLHLIGLFFEIGFLLPVLVLVLPGIDYHARVKRDRLMLCLYIMILIFYGSIGFGGIYYRFLYM